MNLRYIGNTPMVTLVTCDESTQEYHWDTGQVRELTHAEGVKLLRRFPAMFRQVRISMKPHLNGMYEGPQEVKS